MQAGNSPIPRKTPKDHMLGNTRPIGTILTQIFTPIDTEAGHKPRSLQTSPNSHTFIPFVNERNKMNRLILPFATVEDESVPDEQDSWRSYNIGGYRGLIRHTLKVSKKSNKHLSNLLNLETDPGVVYSSPPSIQNTEYFTYITEGSERPSTGFPMFRVNWQAPQKPTITLRKTANYFNSKESEPSSTNSIFRKTEPKPQAIFMSSTRDRLEEVRLKPSTGKPDMCRYNVSAQGAARPKTKNVIIPKAPLEREKQVPENNAPFMTIVSAFNGQAHHKSVPDFSRQLGRQMMNSKKKVENIKDIEQMEKDFQFANQLKQKYDLHTIKFPKNVVVDPKKFPYTDSKLGEAKRNIMRKYDIEPLVNGRKLKVPK